MDELLGTPELFKLAERNETFRTRYNVDTWSTIGEGSLAIVGRVYCNDWGHDVAVKLIRYRIDLSRQDTVRAEVVNAKAVNSSYVLHPISPYFRGDLTWIEMPYVAGVTLANELGRRRFTFDEALSLSLNLLDALRAAHAVAVVHRDIKPANLLIPADGPLRLLVLDFGISRAGEAVRMTATGFPGTPEYAPPEAYQGRPVAAPGDVYSATTVLYQLFTAQQPWPITDKDNLSIEQLCHLRLGHLGPPRRPRDIVEALPHELDAILYRGLDLDPARRPSADELHKRIEGFRPAAGPEPVPVAVAEPPPPEPVAEEAGVGARPSRRRMLALVGAGAAVAVVLLALLFARVAIRTPSQVGAQAVLARVSLRASDPWHLAVHNATDRDISSVRFDLKDAAGQAHYLTIDALPAGRSLPIEARTWTPPLDQPLPQEVSARATVAGIVEEATLSIATPTPAPQPTPHPLPQGLTARADERRALEITNTTKRKLAELRLTVIDARGAIHDVDEGELEPGMSTLVWPRKWHPALALALPKDVLVAATVDGERVRGTLSIASP